MPTPILFSGDPKKYYESESSRLKAEFTSSRDGLAFPRGRSSLIESIVLQAFSEFSGGDAALAEGAVLLAVEDFGRQLLFPNSQVNLLFLFSTEHGRGLGANAVHRLTQRFGQAGFKIQTDSKALTEF